MLRAADAIVLGCFVLECIVRLLAERRSFFCGPTRTFNVLEAMVTIVSVIALVKDYCSSTVDSVDRLRYASALRIVRAVPMIKKFRLFRTMRVMMYSIVACLKSLAWALFLLFCSMFMLALYLEHVALLNVQLHNIGTGTLPQGEWAPVEQQLRDNWGDLFQTMLSLLKSVTGGEDWGNLAAPFCTISNAHCVVYSFWVIIVIFGLINITVGIYSRQAQEYHKYDRRLIVEGALSDLTSMRQTLRDLFDWMDENAQGFLSRAELEKGLRDEHLRAYFVHLNIDIEMNPDEFWRLLDIDGNDRLDKQEFENICPRLQGGAKPLEIARIMSGVEEIKSQLREVREVQLVAGMMDRPVK